MVDFHEWRSFNTLLSSMISPDISGIIDDNCNDIVWNVKSHYHPEAKLKKMTLNVKLQKMTLNVKLKMALNAKLKETTLNAKLKETTMNA